MEQGQDKEMPIAGLGMNVHQSSTEILVNLIETKCLTEAMRGKKTTYLFTVSEGITHYGRNNRVAEKLHP